MKWKLYKEIFISWFKIGLFTFGGGYAMLPLIEKEVIDRKGWATREEIMDIFALSQSIPGAIAINTSIFLGQRLAGIGGAIVAALGVVIPSVIVILLIAVYFMTFQNNSTVMAVFAGIRAAIVGLVSAAAVRITSASCGDHIAVVFVIISVLVNQFTQIHAAWIIAFGAIAGIFIYYFMPNRMNSKDVGEDTE